MYQQVIRSYRDNEHVSTSSSILGISDYTFPKTTDARGGLLRCSFKRARIPPFRPRFLHCGMSVAIFDGADRCPYCSARTVRLARVAPICSTTAAVAVTGR